MIRGARSVIREEGDVKGAEAACRTVRAEMGMTFLMTVLRFLQRGGK